MRNTNIRESNHSDISLQSDNINSSEIRTKKELCIRFADKLLRSYPALTHMEKVLAAELNVGRYTVADAQYLISQGARNNDGIRCTTNRVPDPTGWAAIGAEDLCRYLNKNASKASPRAVCAYKAVCWALNEIAAAVDFMTETEAHVVRQVYMDGIPKSAVKDLQGKSLSLYRVNDCLDTAVCCFAQCLRYHSMKTLEHYVSEVGWVIKADEAYKANESLFAKNGERKSRTRKIA